MGGKATSVVAADLDGPNQCTFHPLCSLSLSHLISSHLISRWLVLCASLCTRFLLDPPPLPYDAAAAGHCSRHASRLIVFFAFCQFVK